MNAFFDENVFLENKTAKELYYNHAKDCPILDYHCHLDPKEIWEDRRFEDLSEIWLSGDHYKWRAMRQNGVSEKFITGKAPGSEKFRRFSETVALAPGNPLYAWAHMELKSLFGIQKPLNGDSAGSIFAEANEKIRTGEYSARALIRRYNVKVICTTDDPADSLEYHKKIRSEISDFRVLPTFRPDVVCYGLNREDFLSYLNRLGETENTKISDFAGFLEVLEKRLKYFIQLGCKVADHALNAVPPEKGEYADADAAFSAALRGEKVEEKLLSRYTDYMVRFFALRYAKAGIAMQLHMSALRNVNLHLFRQLGPDCGNDVVGNPVRISDLARMLDDIRKEGALPKIIFYSLNPNDFDAISALTGAFSEEIPGKMQLGSAWWFNDHADGIRKQLHALANAGLLGRFIGMLTDSRSFTSYVRFDYFRRILCSEFGKWVENGEFDPDCGSLIRGISYANAKLYFGF